MIQFLRPTDLIGRGSLTTLALLANEAEGIERSLIVDATRKTSTARRKSSPRRRPSPSTRLLLGTVGSNQYAFPEMSP
jgi:hypothetical protein